MSRTGIWMIVFGVLAFALPALGYDLRWFEYLGGARDAVAVALIVVGAGLVIVARHRRAERARSNRPGS